MAHCLCAQLRAFGQPAQARLFGKEKARHAHAGEHEIAFVKIWPHARALRRSGHNGFKSGSSRAMSLILLASPSVQAFSSHDLAAFKSPD